MRKEIKPEKKTIGEYIQKNSKFVIPDYQRPYSWKIEQCEKLWQDIVEYIENKDKDDDQYFFGTVIINCNLDETELQLIDGQQRTTTFLLLLKALLMKINEKIETIKIDPKSETLCDGLKGLRKDLLVMLYKVKSGEYSLSPSEKDDEIYKNFNLLETNSINENKNYKNELSNILKAKNYDEALNIAYKIPFKQKDNKYTNYFRNFKYFYQKVDGLDASLLNLYTDNILNKCEIIEIKSWDVDQAIKMFNSLNSAGLPLNDSDIISSLLYAEAGNNAESFKNSWIDLKMQLEDLNKKGIVNLDSILMQHMYYNRSKDGNVDSTTPGLRNYFTRIKPSLLKEPIELCNELDNIVDIWEKVSRYPITQVLFKFNENFKLFLASYFYRFKNEDLLEDKMKIIIECMLRLFTVLEIVETGYSSSKFKTFLFKEESKLVDGNITEQEIKADFDKHIRENWVKDDIKKDIEYYDKNSLVYLNEYLFAEEFNKNKKDDEKIYFELGDSFDIEHIMPQSGKNHPAIRNDANIDSVEEFNSVVNKLGNKIILESKINRGIGNEWFRTKVTTNIAEKTGYINSCYPIAKKLVEKYKDISKPYWTKEDIETATKKASERITKFIFGEE
ncbi:DUF262 domain-containing protein [bacterium]|nr:DUF262 domain-containing protein [bacterium]